MSKIDKKVKAYNLPVFLIEKVKSLAYENGINESLAMQKILEAFFINKEQEQFELFDLLTQKA